MKRRISLSKITTFALLLTVTAMILVAGTYAKYTSSASGTDATVVADWSFMVGETDITTSETFTFDLFNTINDITTGQKETNVADGLIAPGTTGDFEFKLHNSSDVTTKYTINLSVDNTSIPLEFSLGDDVWVPITNLSDLIATDIMAIDSKKDVTVQWRWVFGEASANDTALGVNPETITVSANIIATQVNYKFLEKLEQKYEFSYYSTLNDAIDDVNDGTTGINSDSNKESAVAGVYIDENNLPNVVLLKDTTEIYLYPTADMVINLGGNIFTSQDNYGIYCPSGNVNIDGSLPGSGMNVTASDGVPAYGFMIDTACNLTIDGGTYTSIGTNQNSSVVMNRGTVTAQNASFIGRTTTGRMDGFSTYEGSTTNIINSDVLASGQNAKTYGVFVGEKSSVTITDSDIKGYANYNHDGRDYTAASLGIYHSPNSTLTLKNSHVIGNLAGMQTYGTLYIDGGILEGYGHGGIYFTGTSDSNFYVKNATIRESNMFDGYTANNGTNHVGFYIGGNSQNIYMDNCDISSNGHAIVLRATGGEKNNNLYISNSRIPEGREIRIDNNGHKLYNGVGNNFTSVNTTLPEAVIATDIDYSTLFPEY